MDYENDLQHAAHEYGLDSYEEFDRMILESDGSLTGVLRVELRGPRRRLQGSPVG